MAAPPNLDTLEAGLLAGDPVLLAQAITLVESGRATDREASRELLARLAQKSGSAQRIGISGVPGVGKSTLIETLGLYNANATVTQKVIPSSTSATPPPLHACFCFAGGTAAWAQRSSGSKPESRAPARGRFAGRPSPSSGAGSLLRRRRSALLGSSRRR